MDEPKPKPPRVEVNGILLSEKQSTALLWAVQYRRRMLTKWLDDGQTWPREENDTIEGLWPVLIKRATDEEPKP
jgi:hypothetical protein